MNLLTRAEWGARPPSNRVSGILSGPSTGHWNGPKITTGGQSVWDHSVCSKLVRGIQAYHMDGNKWSDIAYNFCVCPHGYIFEGRGLNIINAANGTSTGNKTSHAIMWLAGEGNEFTDKSKIAFRECVSYIAQHTGAPDMAIGHRDWHSTDCPGNERYNWIRNGMFIPGSTPIPNPTEDDMPLPKAFLKGSDGAAHVYLGGRHLTVNADELTWLQRNNYVDPTRELDRLAPIDVDYFFGPEIPRQAGNT